MCITLLATRLVHGMTTMRIVCSKTLQPKAVGIHLWLIFVVTKCSQRVKPVCFPYLVVFNQFLGAFHVVVHLWQPS